MYQSNNLHFFNTRLSLAHDYRFVLYSCVTETIQTLSQEKCVYLWINFEITKISVVIKSCNNRNFTLKNRKHNLFLKNQLVFGYVDLYNRVVKQVTKKIRFRPIC